MTADPIAIVAAARAVREGYERAAIPDNPADLGRLLIPDYHVTPTIRLLSDELVRAEEEPDYQGVLTCPPRTGKSVLTSQLFPVWALARNPDTEIIVKSYADDLAEEHSREARRLIADHRALLGIELSQDKAAVGRWRVAGHRGGMLAGGILSGTTGFGASLLIVDDPIKGSQEADSPAYRRRLLAEFKSSLMTRLMPGGSVVIVLTRWHEADLAGSLLAEPGSRWRHVNVPAISTAGVPDALGRAPGVAMVSAVGRTPEQFAEIRRDVGERAWGAMYLGVPSTPEGGLIKSAWLDQWRLPAAPSGPIKVVVGVDPADSGEGDETGIIAAALTGEGVVALIADVSGHYTSDAWARRAVDLAVDVGASEISVEAFAARATYTRLVTEALSRVKTHRAIRITGWPPKGSDRGKGDAETRALGLMAALETGRCRVAGFLPEFERQAVGWQSGQHQPDRVAAAVVAFDVLDYARGAQVHVVSPIDAARRAREGLLAPPPEWLRRKL